MTDTMDFGIAARVRDAKRCLFRNIEKAVDDLGFDVICGATGARRQDIRDALSDREGRKLPIEWIWAIALVAQEPTRAAIAACLVEALSYGVAPLRPLTDAERLARLEYRLAAKFGAAGAELVEENRR